MAMEIHFRQKFRESSGKQPYTSKHLLRRYLDPKNIPSTPSQEVFGCLGNTLQKFNIELQNGVFIGGLFPPHFQVKHVSFRPKTPED